VFAATEELSVRGSASELRNFPMPMRKDSGFEVSNHVFEMPEILEGMIQEIDSVLRDITKIKRNFGKTGFLEQL